MMKHIECKNLTFSYPGSDRPALYGVNFSAMEGEFVLLTGLSGSGKSTLLKCLKPMITPVGELNGSIYYREHPIEGCDTRTLCGDIGYIMQSPENQIVTDKVYHELAFTLESLGCEPGYIRSRIAETAAFFGLEELLYKNTSELSGGQKQLLALSSVIAASPSILLLDEPTSRLDPVMTSEFISMLQKINRELSITIIIAEQRLNELLPICDRVVIMDKGTVLKEGTPQETISFLKSDKNYLLSGFPAQVKIWNAVNDTSSCPLSVRDGKNRLKEYSKDREIFPIAVKKEPCTNAETAAELSDVYFRYDNSRDIIKDLSFSVKKGTFTVITGGNGTGKTTLLLLIGGIIHPCRGSVQLNGTAGFLPQDVTLLFTENSVYDELYEVTGDAEKIKKYSALCRLNDIFLRHPYDLSGGEKQRLGLCKILLNEPDILLLDEPTNGMDAEFKTLFSDILHDLKRGGKTIIMVSHDLEFCAENADTCAMFFDGGITYMAPPRRFFSDNSFYTTAARKISLGVIDNAVTADDVIFALTGKKQDSTVQTKALDDESVTLPVPVKEKQTFSLKRHIIAPISFITMLAAFIKALTVTDLNSVLSNGGLNAGIGGYAKIYAVLFISLIVFLLSTFKRNDHTSTVIGSERAGIKTYLYAGIPLILIPLTIYIGIRFLGDRKYYFISLLVLLEAMLPFLIMFEGRKPRAREITLIAVLCALGVAGRCAFFMLPGFKPVLALTIITGAAFGGETGFLVGAMTMLLSNIFFGQGPWTPWQMFSMGLCGLISGLLFSRGTVFAKRLPLSVFGAIVALIIYGGIMNAAAAVIWSRSLDLNILLSYYITGLPVDIVHAAATAVFLFFGAEPMLSKLYRIKAKYGFM